MNESFTPLTSHEAEVYLCPGERKPVSRSVHLARLSSGHSACQKCEHRTISASLPRTVLRQLPTAAVSGQLNFDPQEGIRGRLVNDLTRERVSDLVCGILDLADFERRVQNEQGALRIVLGRDGRPESPDLAIGAAQALRQSGVHLIDVNQLSRPAFDFAIAEFQPHLGIYITGGTRGARWNGLDLVESGGITWLTPERIDRLAAQLHRPRTRLGRTPGSYELIDVIEDYEAIVSAQLHALRPLRLGISCPDQGIRQTLRRVMERAPCDLHFLQVNPRSRQDRQGRTLGDLVCERHLDLGVLFESDGRALTFVDETGSEVEVDRLLQILMIPYSDPHSEPRRRVDEVFKQGLGERAGREIQRLENLPVTSDSQGRCWFLDQTPACDALLTLARVLEVLSLTEQPLSKLS